MFKKQNENRYSVDIDEEMIDKMSSAMAIATSYTNSFESYHIVMNKVLERDILARLIVDKFLSEYVIELPVVLILNNVHNMSISVIPKDPDNSNKLIYSYD